MRVSILIISLFFLYSCSADRITIVDNSKSDYEIVIGNKSDSLVIYAASELQDYISKISGCKIPVTVTGNLSEDSKHILIGMLAESDSIEQHKIFYRVNGDNIIIGAGSPKGVLYSVYTFLENELGCLWLSPEVEIVPESVTLRVDAGLDYEYIPDIWVRTVHSRLFYENPVFANKHKVTDEAFPGYVPGARVHTFHRFMPASAFYDEHPEYYALRDGKRLTTQLCLTNPEVLDIVTDSVAAHFSRHPESGIVSVSQDDNTLHCQCENCAAIDEEEGSASGTMIRFVNKIAERFPDKTISTLAYQYTRKPGKTRPASNVLVTLCSIECDRSKPIEEGCVDFADDLRGWKELSDNIRIWDYTTQFTNFLAPFPNIHTLAPNIRFFRDNNARWIFEQHSNNPSELFELRSYLTARLLWDPDRNPEEIIDEFTEAYYGDAGKYIKEYIDIITAEIKKVPDFFLFLYGDPSQGFDSFLRPELLETYDMLFDKAEQAVQDQADILDRVQVARLSTHYAALEASRKNLTEYYKLSSSPERLDLFEDICKRAGITLMNEMGYSVDEYIEAYKKTLQRSQLPNIANGKKVQSLTLPKKYAAEDPGVLTDGAYGGASFYSNWLGYEGNDLDIIIDLGEEKSIETVHTAFLQVTNHIVFFPEYVEVSFPDAEEVQLAMSSDAQVERPHSDGIKINTGRPLQAGSKVNDIEYFNFSFEPVKTRYVRVYAQNMKNAPDWHHASGLPAWVFCDEIIIN